MSEDKRSYPRVCIERTLPLEQQARAAVLSLQENAANEPDPVAVGDLVAALGVEPPLAQVINTRKDWRGGRAIRVSFVPDHSYAHMAGVREAVRRWFHEWSRYASVRFRFVGVNRLGEVRISFRRGGSWSYIGTDALSIPHEKPTMQLGWVSPNSSPSEVRSVVCHEAGHVLALAHEHQNKRGQIDWNREAVYRDLGGPPNYWSRAQVDANIFAKLTAPHYNHGRYDRGSIMHYAIPREWVTDPRDVVGMNGELSGRDKRYIASRYPKSNAGAAPAKLEERSGCLLAPFSALLGRFS